MSDTQMVSYAHGNDDRIRFRAYKTDRLPPWATDVRDEPDESASPEAASDTPRTNASIGANHFNAWSFTAAEHARQLERELNQAIKERDDARECLREAVRHADSFPEAYPIEQVERWREAAGMELK